MSLVTIVDRIHQRLEAENADRGTYTSLANELESAAAAETDFGRAGKLRSMANALRKISQQEEDHLKALTRIYQDLGNMQRQKGQATARAEAVQLAKGAATAGRAGARLAGRGIKFLGEKLSSLETEGSPTRLPVISYNDVVRGLSMPGEKARFVKRDDYYLDARLSELRSVRMPHTTIGLNEFEVEYFKERAR